MENDRESDISNEMRVQEKDSGTDMGFSGEELPHSSKAIRGRKKPAYVSPYRQQKSVNRASVSSKITVKQTKVQPPPELIRQSTFVKDEPTNEDVPVVDVPKTSTTKIASAKFNENSAIKKPKLFSSAIPKVCVPQRSNSTATIRVSPSIKLNRNKQPSTQPPSRSNSTLSKFNGTKLNQIGSKISGIWKNKTNNIESSSPTTIIKNKINSRSKTFDATSNVEAVASPTQKSFTTNLKVSRNFYQTSSTKYNVKK